ncbi:MAG: hypothetical protein COX16_07465 [Deltaproteobacteria bacterium CG23_combo_of_CG06-09_8_20_14_all_51_20]|nr:MAG: hypothetical protein COX16_07465 [Deltaproteobacteria bacterium CG23_combo_of_CG06-09_8_20_14_all_51_20]PIY21829.1 MAG: hypothetical protein COZ11_14995 [Deltaproteobacteria bacterium CG_4_10_14_3_um_filter_51_14]PJB36983.1 MAG: hypothetical protein CO107_06205 [Deltaproteobacteria bacterium CG_4_9_14_3_um_filter_51_14]
MSADSFSPRFRRWLFGYSMAIILFLGVLIFGATIWPMYGQLKTAQENHLRESAETIAAAVEQWLQRGKALACQISSRTMIREKLEIYNEGKMSLHDLQLYTQSKLIDAMELSDEVAGITRLADDNQVVAQCGKSIPEKCRPEPPENLSNEAVGEPFYCDGSPYLVIRTQIVNRQGKKVGADLVLLTTSALRRLITDYSYLGERGCVILGFRRGDAAYSFFSSCRPHDGVRLSDGAPVTVTGPMGQAMLGADNLVSREKMTIARAPVAGSGWSVVVSIDWEDFYGPVIRRLTHTLWLPTAFTVVTLVGLWLLLRPLAGKMILHTSELEKEVRERKRAQEELNRLNQELASEYNKRKELSKRLIDLLEGVRRGVAQDLHDHTGQILTTLRMELEQARDALPSEAETIKSKLNKAMGKLSMAQKGLKSIARGLLPPTLDYVGLVPALEALFDDLRVSARLKIRFFTKDVPKRFAREKEVALYRIAQEAITNVIKHSQAEEVHVTLVGRGEVIILSVEDNGIGFEFSRILRDGVSQDHLGLTLMRERAIQLGGEFSVDSRPGGGTHLMVELPL